MEQELQPFEEAWQQVNSCGLWEWDGALSGIVMVGGGGIGAAWVIACASR